MNRDELDSDLARLAAATDEVAGEARMTDVILAAVSAAAATEEGDALSRIARATRSLDARPEIGDAVMDHLRAPRSRREAPSWIDGVVRTGPIAVVIAAVVAAASLSLFFSSEGTIDATLISAAEVMEDLE